MNEKVKTSLIALVIVIVTLSLILNPKESLDASLRGLNIWWGVVFPSLLPFFIISELLISFGIVSFLGVLLEPLMRPLFRVPGVGGFVWAMGMASGLPAGAKLSAALRKNNQLSQIEAERLVSFTNSSNPLFIFGAISVGFFQNASLGIVLAASHYLSNASVGIIMRFYGKNKKIKSKARAFDFIAAFGELHQTRMKETRPLGKILGDAIYSSVQTLLMIGGFIILFSVLNKVLIVIGFMDILSLFLIKILELLTLPATLAMPFLAGIFELTLGAQLTSNVEKATLFQQVMITSFILAFGGLSVHAQVASILAETDIRFKPYFFARCIQAFLAIFFVWLLWKPLYLKHHSSFPAEIPVFLHTTQIPIHTIWQAFYSYGPLITLCTLYIYLILLYKKYRPAR